MKTPQLIFNVVTFDHPPSGLTFHFSKTEQPEAHRIHKFLFPKQIDTIFPEILKDETEHIYTTFTTSSDGFSSLTLNLQDEKHSLAKRHYNHSIHSYFKKKGFLVKPNFVNDTQIWIKTEEDGKKNNGTIQFETYSKFSIRVEIARHSKFPELLVAYDGVSKVLKQNIEELITDYSPTLFNWVIYNNALIKFEHLPDIASYEYDKVFPVFNFGLRRAFNHEVEAPDKSNRYKKYMNYIGAFYENYLNSKDFKAIIPIHKEGFIKVPAINISAVSPNSNRLAFGKNTTDVVPYNGLKTNGPLKPSPHKKLHFFFIVHQDNSAVAIRIDNYFKGVGSWFKGLLKFSTVPYHTVNGFSITFSNKENPIPEIEEKLLEREFDSEVKYIAIYITPYSKHEADQSKKQIYYKVKELLLKRNITSQAIEVDKVEAQGENYVYSLANIATAILAKIDGVPWRLDTTIKNELIVGIGAFKHIAADVQYIGSAFSFDNNGKFNRFECFARSEMSLLAGSIARAVKEYATINSSPERLIIHFYKNMSNDELEPIEAALDHLGLSIPVFIITINKTESSDIVAFDTSSPDLMPHSGTYINIGRSKYLLFNNTRYPGSTSFNSNDGFPFPIKLGIKCTNEKELNETKTVQQLIDQVYQFSRMYWKSVRQQNLPVTIKYPEMVAEIAPYFQDGNIPDYGKDNLWFL